MKKLSSIFILIILCQSSTLSQSKLPAYIAQKLDSIIKKESREKHLSAFSIVLVDENGIIHDAHHGSRSIDNPTARVNANTIYRTGSVGKTITDLAILIAVEHGKLELDKDIRSYIPEFHPLNQYTTPITLRHLIKHQSGLVREPPVGNYFDNTSPTLEETVNSLSNTTLLWEPGSKTKYSNAGLAVVGRALEKVYDMKYEMILDSLIFSPLGMKNSKVGFDSSMIDNLAKGYMWFPEQELWEAPLFDLGMKPAGDLYISILDMATLMIGFLNPDKRLISHDLFNQMWMPSPESENWRMDVGIGFSLLGDFEKKYQLARHGGAVYGYSTELAIVPKEGLGVYAVATKDMSGEAKAIATWLLKAVLADRNGLQIPKYIFNGLPFQKLPNTLNEYSNSTGQTNLTKYVGTYGEDHNPLNIYEHEGKLYGLIEWFFLYPMSENNDGTYSFPTSSLYNYEKIKFMFQNEKSASEVIIGNGRDGVHFKRKLN